MIVKVRCAICDKEYYCDYNPEEVQLEMQKMFGPILAENEYEPVCDQCFEQYHPRKYPEAVREAKENFIKATKSN